MLVKDAGAGGIGSMRREIRCWKDLEKEARDARIGLWADPQPVPPWIYTNARRGQSLDLSDLVASTEKPFVTGEERPGSG